ncbi:MAG: DNA primase [bacterium]|nr:DNA primase [bacterium]
MISPVQEIKDRLDIAEFIRSYIPLVPAGKNFKAPCPFHKEKTPSFIVSPERQTWHCFGACAEGGDIFKFLMKYENLEFYEALKILAEKAGIELKKISPAEQRQFGVLYDINDSAKEFFKKKLEQSAESLKYLLERGLKKETIEEFELGLSGSGFSPYGLPMRDVPQGQRSPEGRDELTKYLINSGFNIKDIERAGLNFKTERGSYIDRFRERIMFPIYNHFGKVVGFSGRILESSIVDGQQSTVAPAKYINSPETPIFNKSRLLYGFHKTKNHIREQKFALLVEGQMDFLMVYQDGVKNVAAVSGTALTVDHLKTLRRLADQLVLYFDNDEAGLNAAERSIDLAAANDFSVKILFLKEHKDPAEAVLKSPGKLLGLIDEAKHAMEFYFDRYLQSADKRGLNADLRGNINEFKKNIRIILGKIKNLTSPVERGYWLKELSLKTKIEEKALAEEMAQFNARTNADYKRTNTDSQYKSVSSPYESVLSRRELIAQRMISLIMIKEDFQSQLEEYFGYLPDDYSIILKSLLKREKLSDERLSGLFNLISLRSSFEASIIDEDKIDAEFQEILRNLHLEYLKDKRQGLMCLIKESEHRGEEGKTASVLKEFDEVSKAMHSI